MERMQVEKDKGNILTDRDYINKESKDVNTAMGLQKNNNNKNNKRKVAKTANGKDEWQKCDTKSIYDLDFAQSWKTIHLQYTIGYFELCLWHVWCKS